jgi:hypothetical protein
MQLTHRLAVALVAAVWAACTAPVVQAPPPVAVTVVIDYGHAGRAPETEQALMPAGTSPIEALLEVADVDQRYVSRTGADVWSVDGVATDVEAGCYWHWRLNGQRVREAPDRYRLKNGDHVTWSYARGERPDYK